MTRPGTVGRKEKHQLIKGLPENAAGKKMERQEQSDRKRNSKKNNRYAKKTALITQEYKDKNEDRATD